MTVNRNSVSCSQYQSERSSISDDGCRSCGCAGASGALLGIAMLRTAREFTPNWRRNGANSRRPCWRRAEFSLTSRRVHCSKGEELEGLVDATQAMAAKRAAARDMPGYRLGK